MALTTTVNGLTSANVCSASGMESVGTKADEMNVSGKTVMKPSDCADSGEDDFSPKKAKIHEKT